MCGISGFFSLNTKLDRSELIDICKKMSSTLASRGPDDQGILVKESDGLSFAHRRLAIQDLSQQARQPMESNSGRFTICYNGEVYNFNQLKKELRKSYEFKNHSDTEVVLAACEIWGLDKTLSRLNGMYAFALWDNLEKSLYLIRDRVGIKPLYFLKNKNEFIFASQLKAILASGYSNKEVDIKGVFGYLNCGYVPPDYGIVKGITQVAPGSVVKIDRYNELTTWKYWDSRKILFERERFAGDFNDAASILENLIEKSIAGQMISDRPIGAFLSGGIDSSLVTSIMQEKSASNVKTFTIGFKENSFDESKNAKLVAEHLGTEHLCLTMSESSIVETVDKIIECYDEPFADCSQLPTYLISQMTREFVTVALSGDGGDEVFCGYNRYLYLKKLSKVFKSPLPIRKFAGRAVSAISVDTWDLLSKNFSGAPKQFGDKLLKAAKLVGAPSIEDAYLHLLSGHFLGEQILNTKIKIPPGALLDLEIRNKDLYRSLQYIDLTHYLPGDILTKVDRASMAFGLEVRVPLLDHEVIEFGWSLPDHFKIVDTNGKLILKKILSKYIPNQLVDRPKMGFGVPIDKWLRTTLKEWAHEIITTGEEANNELLNFHLIKKKWEEHLSGKRNWHYQLWTVLMFLAWKKKHLAS